ncbi:hypothetical protein CCZ01_03675 [Helicobacter monodelphidis]|uniref:sulfurtransferase TusA family protein n=1 Tax=Helicobacter sp. 15-1451 TaxID=2004995 RepID=UPI000DCF506F|nr:sulfurtransferase TusA family protein [Helicobacter sp. 15-1451]RAX58184.1 hypothetical protein CCZ01_03675 [Helicobacter sp. 15-1451]
MSGMEQINVCGLSNPEPLLRVQEILKKDFSQLRIICDCGMAVESIERFLQQKNCHFHKGRNPDTSFTLWINFEEQGAEWKKI